MCLGLALQARPKVQAIQRAMSGPSFNLIPQAPARVGKRSIAVVSLSVTSPPGIAWETKDEGNPRTAFQGTPFQAPERFAAPPFSLPGFGPVVRHKDHNGILLQLFVCKNLEQIANPPVQFFDHVPIVGVGRFALPIGMCLSGKMRRSVQEEGILPVRLDEGDRLLDEIFRKPAVVEGTNSLPRQSFLVWLLLLSMK